LLITTEKNKLSNPFLYKNIRFVLDLMLGGSWLSQETGTKYLPLSCPRYFGICLTTHQQAFEIQFRTNWSLSRNSKTSNHVMFLKKKHYNKQLAPQTFAKIAKTTHPTIWGCFNQLPQQSMLLLAHNINTS